jgi:small conductance mechanosensitive channel
VTRLRAEDETIWYVRNGEILKVGNKSQRVDPAVPAVGTRVAENEQNEGLAPEAGTRSDPRP